MLDIAYLRSALASLESAIRILDTKASCNITPEAELKLIKAGVIQNFEFTYEMAWKALKRWIATNINPEAAEGISRKELFRFSLQNGLIVDFDDWMTFTKARNITSHTYNVDLAEEVLSIVKPFIKSTETMINELEKRS